MTLILDNGGLVCAKGQYKYDVQECCPRNTLKEGFQMKMKMMKMKMTKM